MVRRWRAVWLNVAAQRLGFVEDPLSGMKQNVRNTGFVVMSRVHLWNRKHRFSFLREENTEAAQWEVLVVYDTNVSSNIKMPLVFKQKWQLGLGYHFLPCIQKIPQTRVHWHGGYVVIKVSFIKKTKNKTTTSRTENRGGSSFTPSAWQYVFGAVSLWCYLTTWLTKSQWVASVAQKDPSQLLSRGQGQSQIWMSHSSCVLWEMSFLNLVKGTFNVTL